MREIAKAFEDLLHATGSVNVVTRDKSKTDLLNLLVFAREHSLRLTRAINRAEKALQEEDTISTITHDS